MLVTIAPGHAGARAGRARHRTSRARSRSRSQAGHHHLTALSPDGRTMALLSLAERRHRSRAAVAHRPRDVDGDTHRHHARADRRRRPPGPRTRRAAAVAPGDARGRPVQHPARLPADALDRGRRRGGTVRDPRRRPRCPAPPAWSATTLFVYGQPVDTDYLAADVPHLVRIDLATETITGGSRADGRGRRVSGGRARPDGVTLPGGRARGHLGPGPRPAPGREHRAADQRRAQRRPAGHQPRHRGAALLPGCARSPRSCRRPSAKAPSPGTVLTALLPRRVTGCTSPGTIVSPARRPGGRATGRAAGRGSRGRRAAGPPRCPDRPGRAERGRHAACC